ncbi:cell division protein FtsL [Bdellovibrionales bacterium]|nr:cell division protein FtsL [Bdellovibrionales bacterium]
MRRSAVVELRPFFSVLLIICSLFSVVFIKMEARRVGYSILRDGREFKRIRDEKRKLVMKYARITRSARVRRLAMSRLTLDEAKNGQVIQMYGTKVALRQ